MTTSSQGEPMSGLTRMSNRDHRNIVIEPGDTVIVSASPIPGNEEAVAKTIDNLFKGGGDGDTSRSVHCHVSGHGSREGAEADARPLRPPRAWHGGSRMLVQHSLLTEAPTSTWTRSSVLENGQVVKNTTASGPGWQDQ